MLEFVHFYNFEVVLLSKTKKKFNNKRVGAGRTALEAASILAEEIRKELKKMHLKCEFQLFCKEEEL